MRNVLIGANALPGYFTPMPAGTVVFAHGSGSGRDSPRNQFVARELERVGLGTLLLDLLTDREASDRRNVFDIPLLASRLLEATDWVARQPGLRSAPIGYFGASTGAAAALVAAARSKRPIAAVVSRGGRPDLAGDELRRVTAPTLLIVGAADAEVLDLNRQALEKLHTKKHLEIIPLAGHLFEEPGTLEQVVVHARSWFENHFLEERFRAVS